MVSPLPGLGFFGGRGPRAWPPRVLLCTISAVRLSRDRSPKVDPGWRNHWKWGDWSWQVSCLKKAEVRCCSHRFRAAMRRARLFFGKEFCENRINVRAGSQCARRIPHFSSSIHPGGDLIATLLLTLALV